MSFTSYDIYFLVAFIIFISTFLYLKRKNLKKEGLLFLYKTKWGIKLINKIGNKYKKTLKAMSYISIGLGYFLMATMIYLFGRIIWIYLFVPEVVKAVKVPPIMPLIPYLPQIFKLDFLPPFYFTYWIVILAIIAITHELAHGIFAAYNKIKIKRTGFGFFPFFLPVFLAAFVELDEKKMAKKDKFAQMSILSAGTFANVLTGIFFMIVLWIFFSMAFVPSGIVFDTYAYSVVGLPAIISVNGIQINNPAYEDIVELSNGTKFSKIETRNSTYIATQDLLKQQPENPEYLFLYSDAPAINAELEGIILEINENKINSREDLGKELQKYSPGETINIKTKLDKEVLNYEITLEEHPSNKSLSWMGIAFLERKGTGVIGRLAYTLNPFKKANVNYEPKFDGFSQFIYNLLWWLILISISVALVNMIPMGIFDGGRFFYLTILGITKDPIKSRKAFRFMTSLLLFLVILLMVFWAWNIFT